jgi:hypothetical protein
LHINASYVIVFASFTSFFLKGDSIMADSERLEKAVLEFQNEVATSWAKCENGGLGGIESEEDLRLEARRAARNQGLLSADERTNEAILQQILNAPIQ